MCFTVDTTNKTASKIDNTVFIPLTSYFNIYFTPLWLKLRIILEFVFDDYSSYRKVVDRYQFYYTKKFRLTTKMT